MTSSIDPGSRSRLTPRQRDRFAGATLFDAVARALCDAGCVPRKELYESFEVARRVKRRMRGGRVVDLACGHGLLAHILLLLDDTLTDALAVDARLPPSAARARDALCAGFPQLAGRVDFRECLLDDVVIEPADLVVSVHACGALTDTVLTRAVDARARLAVLPCCHDLKTCDAGGLIGWMDGPLAIDATRVARLRSAGYTVHTATIPETITPKNRLIMAAPTLHAR